MDKAKEARKPQRESLHISFSNAAFPNEDCGMTLNLPAALYVNLPELRKIFRLIATNGTENFPLVDDWIIYETVSHKNAAAVSEKEAKREALAGKKMDAKKSAAAAKREAKEAAKLESRRRLLYQIAGKEIPEDEPEEQEPAAAKEAEAERTENTSRKAERKITMTHFDFFAGCETPDEARKRYYTLAKLYHTDAGTGDDDAMAAINDQYSAYCGRSAVAGDAIPELPAGVLALPEHLPAVPAAVDEAAEYMNVIAALIKIPGIEIEICGKWLWISGDTKPVKDEIKAAGCRFSGGKKMWYWHPAEEGSPRRRGSGKSMGYIREKYGSRRIKAAEETA